MPKNKAAVMFHVSIRGEGFNRVQLYFSRHSSGYKFINNPKPNFPYKF